MFKNFFLIIFLILCFVDVYSQIITKSRYSCFEIDAPQLASNRKIWMYLPLDYDKSDKKYPVIYMHDGQNLFDAKTSYAGEWAIDETLDSLKANVIVVGIENGGDKRLGELTPFNNAKHGGGKGDRYLDFLVNNLKPFIDKNYRTKTNVRNTAIFGSSLGGLISFYAALKYPEVFGKVGCFSPSFWFNRAEIFELMKKENNLKTKIYFLCGDNEGDEDMVKDLNSMELLVNSKRCICKKLNKKLIVKDGQHNEKLWREGFINAYLWLF
ncbi:MAG: alpha/beta hydrolase [Flavobacterium sp.]|nr:alpha/beta hydrolase [Flavobacterium sp.]